jgi:hypothetical protein
MFLLSEILFALCYRKYCPINNINFLKKNKKLTEYDMSIINDFLRCLFSKYMLPEIQFYLMIEGKI